MIQSLCIRNRNIYYEWFNKIDFSTTITTIKEARPLICIWYSQRIHIMDFILYLSSYIMTFDNLNPLHMKNCFKEVAFQAFWGWIEWMMKKNLNPKLPFAWDILNYLWWILLCVKHWNELVMTLTPSSNVYIEL